MTNNNLESLLNNGVLSESTRTAITEALKAKEDEIRNEIREEFAVRFEKDKNELVEAADMMIKDVLAEYLEEVQREKENLTRATIRVTESNNKKLKEFGDFIENVLEEEMSEFRDDRRATVDKIRDLEKLVSESLVTVVKGLHEEKRQLAEDRVKLKVNSERELAEAKQEFLTKAALLAEEFIEETLNEEMAQLKEEINEAKQNLLGRKIFEAFQVEFVASHFNEKAEVKKFKSAISEREIALEESKKEKEKVLAENVKLKQILAREKDKSLRENTMNKLLSSLGGEKRSIMADLLEKVPTGELNESFSKYLPVLLEESNVTKDKRKLNESRVLKTVTGDRASIIKSDEKTEDTSVSGDLIQAFVQGVKKIS